MCTKNLSTCNMYIAMRYSIGLLNPVLSASTVQKGILECVVFGGLICAFVQDAYKYATNPSSGSK